MKKFVLIGGLPRSGTTLVETIIGSHSKISIPPGDFPFVEYYVRGWTVKQIFEEITGRKVAKFWHVRNFSDLYNCNHKNAFIKSSVRYADGIQKEVPGLKAPYLEFYFNVVQDWLSDYEIKFIHVVRNPFDHIASLKHSHLHKSKYQKELKTVRLNCRNWCRSVSMGLAQCLFHRERYFLLKYEDLADNPLDTSRKLCRFLGVDIEEERMLNRVDYPYHNSNTSFPNQIGKIKSDNYVYPRSSRKHYLIDSEVRIIDSICGELSRVMGYEDKTLQMRPHEIPSSNSGVGILRKLGGKLKRYFFPEHRSI